MSHLPAFALCLAGFAALGFAMDRQQRDLLGRPLRVSTTRPLRLAGTCALLLAPGVLVSWRGWGLGLVLFSGHTSLAAGLGYCACVTWSRVPARPPPPRASAPVHTH